MTLLRSVLVVMLAVVLIYTAFTVSMHGPDLLPHFFGAIRMMTWQGQFNLDFLMLLLLSGVWTAWRNGFSAVGIGLGIAATLLGTVFLSAYLLYLLHRTEGDPRQLLLGVHAKA